MDDFGEDLLPVAVPINEDDVLPEAALVVVHQPLGAPMIEGLRATTFVRNHLLRGRTIDRLSSFLYDLIREDCTCTSVLSGWSHRGCCRIVDYCRSNPDQTFYTSPGSGRTPLHEACLRGSCLHVIRALLDANAHAPMERDQTGNTPLHLLFVDFSTRSTNPVEMDEIVQLLLHGNPAFLAAAVNESGCTALHMACSAPETMIHSSSLRRILAANPSCASILNNCNQCALTLHCQRKNASTEVAELLYDAFPGAMQVLDRTNGWSPFHYACSNSNSNLIQFFVARDPDVAYTSALTNLRTGLHILCQQHPTASMTPTLKAMVCAAPETVGRTDVPSLQTPLHLVCQSPRVSLEVVQLLVDALPEAARICDTEQYLPLHHACEVGAAVEVISLLVSVYSLGASALTRKHDTALSLACATNKSVKTIRCLIEANREAVIMKNDYGFAPLHCVCRAFQPRMGIVQALLEANPFCIQLRTNAGETPVHVACANSGTYVGVLQLLSMAQNKANSSPSLSSQVELLDQTTMEKNATSKIGNTPRKFFF